MKHSLLQTLGAAGADLIFPRRCLGCGRFDTVACVDCLARRRAIETVDLDPKAAGFWQVDSVVTLGPYADPFWRALVTQLKFGRQRQLAEVAGLELAAAFSGLPDLTAAQPLLVPVPLHSRRQRQRGFNQAALIAQVVSRETGWPCANQAVRRTRATPSQTTCNYEERLTNPVAAFALNPRFEAALADRLIVLVDDVITTGATLAAAADVLRQAGAAKIIAAAIARGH